MTDFQSEFVFGLHGKRYQDFITGVAKPEIEKVLGTSDYEIIGFEGHLSFKDFENDLEIKKFQFVHTPSYVVI